MKPMSMAIWTFLLLASAGIYALGVSNGGHISADHDHEPHGHETTVPTPAAGVHSPDPSAREDHGQDDVHGEQHSSRHGAEDRHDHHDRQRKDDGHGHSDEHGHAEEEPGEVHLTPEQLRMLGVRTERLAPRALGETLRAPGEVRLNAYASAHVAPRIVAQVTERHARLGDQVEAGRSMVTLSSVEMGEAQGDLVVADREWQRVRKLGRKVVSASRYLEAQIGRQQARARVMAFGMTPGQVDELLRSGPAMGDGTFALLAPRAGTVIADSFVLGEVIEAGRTLFEITDESVRWVEARMAPEDAARVSVGDPARVRAGAVWLDGRVTQHYHRLDETTRTQAIRVEVPDPDHRLHPGIFVDVEVYAGEGAPVLALPEAAVVRSPDGDWQTFVAEDEAGSFKPVEVTLVRTTGGLAVIEGLAPGTEVVIHGAFFLQSELAKGGFDIHQH